MKFKKKFPVWEPRKCFLIKVIYYIQDIFYNPIYFNKNNGNYELSNQEQNIISKCFEESINNCYVNEKNSRNIIIN